MKLFEVENKKIDSDNRYNAESIEVLKGLDPVKRRPGMYTDTSSPDHLAYEVIDNCVDEAIAGYANRIELVLKADNSIIVSDNGRGMPVDIHPEEKISGVDLIMSKLHAGAKFSNKDYSYSGGLHGVGVSVVNALTLDLSIHIKRNGHKYHIGFKNGIKSQELEIIKNVAKNQTGTSIWFYPDPSYFDTPYFSKNALKKVLKSKAVLCKGLVTQFFDEKSNEKISWKYDHGLDDYLNENLNREKSVFASPFTGETNGEDIQIIWAVNWTMESGGSAFNPQESYVNLIPTSLGGTHVNGFRSGLLESVKEFCKFQNLLPRGLFLAPEDIWHTVGYILSVKLTDAQFSGQTKERLSSRHCANLVNIQVRDAFSLWLNQNIKEGESLASLVIENAKTRIKKSKKVTKKKMSNGMRLPAKLSDCTSIDHGRRELFFVEGDSAGGSAKQARDRRFQAIMPLRGKILNTWDIDSSAILESREIRDISRVIGVLPGSEDISKLRYNKICVLADADSDGLHIATLICALFLKHFPKIVQKGHLHIAMPPLYRIDSGKAVFYALDDLEKESIIKRIKRQRRHGKINVQRFKGLGEMNPSQLKETTISPDSRRLVKLSIDYDSDDSIKKVFTFMDMLLGKKRAKDRKIWIETKGNIKEIDQ
jgi:topoisomerase IV subunit B